MAYMDDAGNSGANLADPIQPYHYVGSIIVSEGVWAQVRAETLAVMSLTHPIPGIEVHASDIWNGKGAWRGLALQQRAGILESCMGIVERHRLPFVYGRCNKGLLAQRYSRPFHPHYIAGFLCLERICRAFDRSGELGVIVADQNREVERLMCDLVREYRQSGPPFGPAINLDRLTDNVHFMPSWESPHMQLCDVLTWLISRGDRVLAHVLEPDALLDVLVQRARGLVVDQGAMPY